MAGVGEDLQALRALADPLRMDLLARLERSRRPLSVRELAAELGSPRNKLHYHVNVLEKHGLVRVAETRLVGGTPERCYETSSRTFDARGMAIPSTVATGLAGMLDSAAREVGARLGQADRRRAAMGRTHFRLSADRHSELLTRISALLDEFDESSSDEDAGAVFVFALYEDENADTAP